MPQPDSVPTPARVVCVLLAGGLGRRMGGKDKALIEVDGRPMIDHIIARVGDRCAATVLNANGDAARFARYGLPVAEDVVPGAVGPLAGVLTGMEWAAAHHPEATHVLSVPADAPFLPDDLLDRLAAAVGEGADIACAMSDGRTHPVIALWPVSLRAALRHGLVEEGARRIDAWTAGFRVAHVEWPTEPLDPFFNVNRPEDVTEAQRLLRRPAEAPPDRLAVGVVLERRASSHPWGDDTWMPAAVLPGLAEDAPARLLEDGRWCSGGLPLELFRKETEGYKRNLTSSAPRVFVILRATEAPDGPPLRPFHVTVCPYEAETYLDGETGVEGVPMPPEVAALVRAFVDYHHFDAPFVKRKQKSKDKGVQEHPFDRQPPVERHRLRQAEEREP